MRTYEQKAEIVRMDALAEGVGLVRYIDLIILLRRMNDQLQQNGTILPGTQLLLANVVARLNGTP